MKNTIYLCVISLFLIHCSPKSKLVVNKEVFKKLPHTESFTHQEDENFVVIEGLDSKEQEALKKEISHLAHESGKCGGFSEVSEKELLEINQVLKDQQKINEGFKLSDYQPPSFKEEISALQKNLSTEKVLESIQLLVNHGSRSARKENPNEPIDDFMGHIKKTLEESQWGYSIEQISHSSTRQNSIRVHVEGSEGGDRVVVLGGHIDSTTSFFSREAPGADDNASGSAIVLETLRVLASSSFKPKTDLDFFWYAGEEQGLLGSKEIAKDYKERGVPVEAVMQLDMVLYPGNGNVVGLVTDYTNTELTQFTEDLSKLYADAPVERFDCGYGCSDHASWHQNGFKTVFPFESTYKKRNRDIHTPRDVVGPQSSVEHALKFSKIAVGFLVELSSK